MVGSISPLRWHPSGTCRAGLDGRDTRLRLWGPDGERTAELGDLSQMAQRWSSCRGPVNGEINVFAAPVDRDGRRALTRLLAYSDGLAILDPFVMPPSNAELADLIDQAGLVGR